MPSNDRSRSRIVGPEIPPDLFGASNPPQALERRGRYLDAA